MHTSYDNPGIIVVIPCFNEPALIATLESLYDCDPTTCQVEVIVVINASENASDEIIRQNKLTEQVAAEWINSHPSDKIHFDLIIENELPEKHAGVGLARKIGMDEAASRFNHAGDERGIIVCFDADSTCDQNYLLEIEKHFEKYLQSPGCSIYFEHPLEGDNYSPDIYNGIANYELHLRFYIQGLRYAGFPYAYHTIGSSMAVRSEVYVKQGGMNKRKAGEDFYFLQKIIPLGDFTELNTTRVIPSPRPSDRVPFGTGKAIVKWLNGSDQEFYTYHPKTFDDLKLLFDSVEMFYRNSTPESVVTSLPKAVQVFLEANDYQNKLKEINANAASKEMFFKRFYQWMNAFRVLKFVHYARDNYYGEMEISEAAIVLLKKINVQGNWDGTGLIPLLDQYRQLDRQERRINSLFVSQL